MSTQNSIYPQDSLLASEIAQQPAVWPTTLERVAAANVAPELLQLPVILTGAGTSAYAASAIAEAWPGAMAIPTTDLLLQSPSEFEHAIAPFPSSQGLLISLARSGESPESTAVVEKMQRQFPGIRHLAIVCNEAGRLARTTGVKAICLDPRTNDRSLAMTGSFSNLVLGGLCLVHGDQLAEQLPAICRRVERGLVEGSSSIEEIAASCKDRIVVLTSTMQAFAREAALKIVELTAGRVMAMAETFLGFRHGPVGFVREDTPVLCFLSSDPDKRRYEEDLIVDLRGRGLGRVIVIGQANDAAAGGSMIPATSFGLPDYLRTPFEIPLVQLLAYYLSVHAKVDPDNPSPDGAITRVVRPFRIHNDLQSR